MALMTFQERPMAYIRAFLETPTEPSLIQDIVSCGLEGLARASRWVLVSSSTTGANTEPSASFLTTAKSVLTRSAPACQVKATKRFPRRLLVTVGLVWF